MSMNTAKASNFDLILRDDLNEIVFNCQSANLPGISIGEINIPYMGQTNQIPGDSLTFNPLMVSVLCDENFEAFEQAYNILTKTKGLDGTYNVEVPVFDALLVLNTNKNNLKKLVYFKNAWVQDISDLSMELTGDDSFLTFTITIKYLNYSFKKSE